MIDFITEKINCWDRIRKDTKPIYLYGMGDGAVKIMSVFRRYGIEIKGIFASDDFVRGHYFAGYKVMKLSEVEEIEDDFSVVLAFAAGYDDLVERIINISRRHTLYVPDVPVIGSGIFTLEYCKDHEEELETAYSLLADEQSKNVFASIVNFKISGDIKHLENITTPREEIYKKIIKPNLNEHYVDLGAYNGDTIKEFMEITKSRYVRIYGVEPDKKNFRKLERAFSEKGGIELYNSAAWCTDTELPFSSKAGRNSSLSNMGATSEMTSARSVDSILKGREASLIKMDVEGAEREALWGCSQTIMRYKPRLMVALYHRTEDIFELPILINKLNPKYKLYIRHQLYIPAWETNLYAVNDSSSSLG